MTARRRGAPLSTLLKTSGLRLRLGDRAFENAADIGSSAPVLGDQTGAIRGQAAR